jgi:beta-glucosidase
MDVEKILQQMTLEDKIALCSGENFWETKAYEKYGVPALFMCDGPHGLRKQDLGGGTDMLGVNESRPATCFPAEVTTAGSWDPALLEEIGAAVGEEARDQGVGLVLGPGANLKRNPLCGRNFEYFGEDPYLAGKLAARFIRGVEGQGVGSSLKHFAANSQELCRFTSDSVMDERTLRELYLTAFETAVKEGKPSTIMCAYPKLNGIHCSDHKGLLTDILREEWGFEGMVVTDWGAMNDRIEGFRAGCDLNMPGGSAYMEKEVLTAVKSGALPESAVDDSARRVLKLVFRAAEARKEPTGCDFDAHHTLAAKAAAAGTVLLKNEGNTLPLKEGQHVALLGHMAKELRFQGAGSSHINPTKVVNPVDAMPDLPFAPGCDGRGNTTGELLAEAAALAKRVEIPVVFAGLPGQYESEGFDRTNMKMPEGHLRLIDAVAEANPNTVVALLCGAPVECPWADKVKAILHLGLPGQAGGQAAADLLYGRVNPSGKLAESWPLRYEDCPSASYYGKTKDALYLEGVYVGYRYYDKVRKAVRWPFGYGLSYTSFGYSELRAEGRRVSVTVANTGNLAGAEVVQLYVRPPQEGIHRPVRELKGFQKVFLQPGEAKTLSFVLKDRAFALWQDGWKVPAGTYGVEVGGLTAAICVGGDTLPAPDWQAGSWYETCSGTPDHAGWERILGRKYTPATIRKGEFTMNNTVMEMKDHSFIMKIMYKAVEATIAKGYGGKADYENPEFRMLMESSAGSPLRSMQISGGMKCGIFQGLGLV